MGNTDEPPPLIHLIYELTECIRSAIQADGLSPERRLESLLQARRSLGAADQLLEAAVVEAEVAAGMHTGEDDGNGNEGGAQ